ncbi:SIS domain-containing protein [Pleomorphomonas sp. PLEO]|uniref:SIS domain-containing protein n=1 Tax=Pleomorphomonas sp. PLEO TaxID=3239306 RepID=UPI00351DD9F9
MQSDQDWLDRARNVVRADAASITSILDSVDDSFLAAARRLSTCRGKILVTGSGTSGNVASRGAHILSVCGTPAFYLSPGDGLHGGLGVLQADDVVLALSKGGSSAELNDFCARAKTLCSGLIAVTADPASPLAAMADHVIVLKLPVDGDLGGVVATGSSLAAAAVTDVLAEMLRVARGYPWENLLFTHPSGAVGRDAEKTLKRLGSN